MKIKVTQNVNKHDEEWGSDEEQLPEDDARSDCDGEEMAQPELS